MFFDDDYIDTFSIIRYIFQYNIDKYNLNFEFAMLQKQVCSYIGIYFIVCWVQRKNE